MPVPQQINFLASQASCLFLKSSSLFLLADIRYISYRTSFLLTSVTSEESESVAELPSFTVLESRGRGGRSYLFSQALWGE